MSKVILVAKIKAKPAHIESVKTGLHGLVAPTRQEAGCIKYDLHQDQKDPSIFIFMEEWESAAHLQNHSTAAHIKAFGIASKGKIESRDLHFLGKV